MAYILSAQRHADPPEASSVWPRYRAYLDENKVRFPPNALALARSDWYFSFSDHRAPHDAWLESATFSELSTGARSEVRSLSLRVKLLGAYHDHWLEFHYPQVFSYSMSSPMSSAGHYDWHYDEFRLSEAGHVVHEVEWAGGANHASRWLIEANDVIFSAVPRGEA